MERIWVFEVHDTHERIEVSAPDFDSAAIAAGDKVARPCSMTLVKADGVDLREKDHEA